MAVAESEYKFVYVDIDSYCKVRDPTIFSDSAFWKELFNGKLKLPEPRHLPNDQGVKVPYVLTGDETIGLHSNLMRPFGRKILSVQKRVFNYHLTRARRFVECTFGSFSNKWRIFQQPLNVSSDLATKIIQACCILHNFFLFFQRKKWFRICGHSITGLQDCATGRKNQWKGLQATHVHQKFAEYFMSEQGSVSWQMSKT